MRTTGVVGVGRTTVWGAGAVAVLVLAGCGAAAGVAGPGAGSVEVSAKSGAPSPADAPSALEPAGIDPDRACTLIGLSGGVYVDLADVLDPAGGPYFAEVESQGASRVTSVPVRPDRDSTAYLDPGLEHGAVVVDVVVRSGEQVTGPVVWTGSGGGTPTLHQPNGPGCGDVYTLGLTATPRGGLIVDPDVGVGGGDPDQGWELAGGALNEVSVAFAPAWPVDLAGVNQVAQVPVPGAAEGSSRYVAVAEFLDAEDAPTYASAVVDVSADGVTTAWRLDAPLTEQENAARYPERSVYEGQDALELVAQAQAVADEMDDIYS